MTTECPNCHMDNAYCDGVQYLCPDCDFEWPCDEIDWAENEQEEIDEDDDY